MIYLYAFLTLMNYRTLKIEQNFVSRFIDFFLKTMYQINYFRLNHKITMLTRMTLNS